MMKGYKQKESAMLTKNRPHKKRPTYEIAELFPAQGNWSEEEYLALDTNHLVELSHGELEVLEMPSDFHQLLVVRLIALLYPFVIRKRLGAVRISPLRVRLWPGKFREPDLIFMSTAHADRIGEKFWGIPDLVAEIISESDEELDRITKMTEYAQAGIPEYWIVDPSAHTVEIYQLQGERYTLRAALPETDTLTSSQLPGFELPLTALFAPE
jgi:Uma2 family endonuclease